MESLFIGFFYILYLFFAAPAMTAPFTYDEVSCLLPAQNLLATGQPRLFTELSVVTTRLHIDIQAFLYKLFGVSDFSSRLLGVACILIQLIMFFFLARALFKEEDKRRKFLFFSLLIFATNPAVIQGSLIPFEDTTLLPPGIFLFILFFLKLKEEPTLRNAFILGALFAVSLWPKPTTPWVLIPAILIYYLLKKDRRGFLYTAAILAAGAFIFLVYWTLYARLRGLDWFEPVKYYFWECFRKHKTCYESYSSRFLFYMPVLVRILLWGGLYSLALAALAAAGRIKNFMKTKSLAGIDFLIIYAVLTGAAYTLLMGMVFGFPKYHYPAFFALAAVSGFAAARHWGRVSRRDLFFYCALAASVFVYLYFFVGDLIYIFNFRIKDAMINAPLMFNKTKIYFIYKYALYLLPSLAVFLVIGYFKKNRARTAQAVISLVIMICASNLSLDLIQSRADYVTRLCYGARGTEGLVRELKEKLREGETVIATNDIIYYLGIPYPQRTAWRDLDTMMRDVGDPRVRFVVYSVTHHTASQFRDIFLRPAVMSKLRKDFTYREIGTYKVWERK